MSPAFRMSLMAGASLLVAAGLWFIGRPPGVPRIDVAQVVATVDEGTITVHVAGEVRSPGLVAIAPSARVADAVEAAGGATSDADLSVINLAAPLQDGEQILVPGRSEDGASATGAVSTDGRVRVNRATVSELEALPGVGPVLAARIASYRDAHGPFATIEDLLDVPGIGEGKLAALRDAAVIP